MPTVRLNWAPPVTRASGKPLKPGDIAGFMIESSIDGAPFTKRPDAAAGATTADIAIAEPGAWRFRVSCFDTKNRTGAPAEGSIAVEDDTPPGVVLNLTVSIAASLATSAT